MIITHATPIGVLTLAALESGLTVCAFREPRQVAERYAINPDPDPSRAAWLDLARAELDAYFAGTRFDFTVPVDLRFASAFDRRVLAILSSSVGYGRTITYGGLATQIGLRHTAARSVGRAMALNPITVILPCHRVLGASGDLTGYAGGLAAKRHLLDLEAAHRERSQAPTSESAAAPVDRPAHAGQH